MSKQEISSDSEDFRGLFIFFKILLIWIKKDEEFILSSENEEEEEELSECDEKDDNDDEKIPFTLSSNFLFSYLFWLLNKLIEKKQQQQWEDEIDWDEPILQGKAFKKIKKNNFTYSVFQQNWQEENCLFDCCERVRIVV